MSATFGITLRLELTTAYRWDQAMSAAQQIEAALRELRLNIDGGVATQHELVSIEIDRTVDDVALAVTP